VVSAIKFVELCGAEKIMAYSNELVTDAGNPVSPFSAVLTTQRSQHATHSQRVGQGVGYGGGGAASRLCGHGAFADGCHVQMRGNRRLMTLSVVSCRVASRR
jgi:hypothetical protein